MYWSISRHFSVSSVNFFSKVSFVLFQTKDSLDKEIIALKESLNLARTRSEWLEGHKNENKEELHKLRTVNQFWHIIKIEKGNWRLLIYR